MIQSILCHQQAEQVVVGRQHIMVAPAAVQHYIRRSFLKHAHYPRPPARHHPLPQERVSDYRLSVHDYLVPPQLLRQQKGDQR